MCHRAHIPCSGSQVWLQHLLLFDMIRLKIYGSIRNREPAKAYEWKLQLTLLL